MNETGTKPSPTRPSTLYVASSACLAAIILGFTLFLLIRGFHWRAALADLRTEPGIEILSIERVGFFKKRLRGLRDPLAPTAESYLRKHQIGDHAAEVILTEYHSLNTPYALQREETKAAEIKSIRAELIETVGSFAEAINEKREEDLEKITQMLFEARFPEAMKTVDVQWKNGAWLVSGELYAPDREVFMAESPDYLIEGELDFSNLINLTETRSKALRSDIEGTNLFETDLDGNLVHLDRIRRLVMDLDEVCHRSELPLPALQLTIARTGADEHGEQVSMIKSALTGEAGVDAARFLPDAELPGTGAPLAKLMLVQFFAP